MTGVPGNAVPPEGTVYHNKFVPVADNVGAAELKQLDIALFPTAGMAGIGLTVTVMVFLGLSQPFTVWLT